MGEGLVLGVKILSRKKVHAPLYTFVYTYLKGRIEKGAEYVMSQIL